MTKNDSCYRSTTIDSVSSLNLNKKVNSRRYISQFTLNDDIIVAVERREEYEPISERVTIEVDISLGICDSGSRDEHYIVRLNDMGCQNSWVFKMTNYDTFVDKDISDSITDGDMEHNKLFLVKHKPYKKTEDKLTPNDDTPLRNTSSQFDPPANRNGDHVFRNELLIYNSEPLCNYVDDKMYTSYVDIDLAKPDISKLVGGHDVCQYVNEIKVENVSCPQQIEDVETCIEKAEKEGELSNDFIGILPPIVDMLDLIDNGNNDDVILFAEDTEDEDCTGTKQEKTLSKYLQYYLPTFKDKEQECFSRHSDVSTCIDSSTEVDSLDGYSEDVLVKEESPNIFASIDEFSDVSEKESSSMRYTCDEVDKGGDNCKETNNREASPTKCDQSTKFEDIICQENIVLLVNEVCSNEAINSFDTKEWSSLSNDKLPTLKLSEKNEFIPVSIRRLQFEELTRPGACNVTSYHNLGIVNAKKHTSEKCNMPENCLEVVDDEILTKEENSMSDNKENELDKESSISQSSGSMIVKDVLSDENMEFFISHNNIEKMFLEENFEDERDENCTLLDQVEEESEGDHSAISVQTSSSRKTAEIPQDGNIPDELESLSSEFESDATSASSFTTSVKIEDIALTELDKAPIGCDSGKFERFLEERERGMSGGEKSSLPLSLDSRSSSYSTDDTCDRDNEDRIQLSIEREEKFLDSTGQIPSLIYEGYIMNERNSSLTKVSSTASLSSSIFSTSEDVSLGDQFADTNNTVIRKEKSKNVDKEASYSSSKTSSKTSSYSSSSDDKDLDNDKEVQLKCLPTTVESPERDKTDTATEEHSPKYFKFHQNKRNSSESSGTEDSSSSSSDDQEPKHQIILRHGGSIENIEELLQQSKPNFQLRKSISLQKQTSLPNNRRNPELSLVKSKSIDHSHKTESPAIVIAKEDLIKRAKITDYDDKCSFSSSCTLSSSMKEEEMDLSKEQVDNTDGNVAIVNKQHKVNQIYQELSDSSSSNDDQLSSSDDGSARQKYQSVNQRGKIDNPEEFRSEKINGKEMASRMSSSSGLSISSSFDDRSLDDKEKVEANGDNTLENKNKNVALNEKVICRSPSSSSSCSSDEDHADKFQAVIIGDNSVENQRNKFKEQNKEQVRDHSCSSSFSLSSSGDEELEKRQSIDQREIVENLDKIRNVKINDEDMVSMHSSSSGLSLSSSSDDHEEKADVNGDNTIGNKEKYIGSKEKVFRSSSSSSYDEESELVKNKSTDHTEKFQTNVIVDNKCKGKELVFEHSCPSSHSLSSSGDEESELGNKQSIDHREIVENIDEVRKEKINDEEMVSMHSSSSGLSLSSSSDEESELRGNKSKNHKETKESNMVKANENNGMKRNDKAHTLGRSSSSSCIPSSSSDEDNEPRKNKSIDHRESFDKFKENVRKKMIKPLQARKYSSTSSSTLSSSSDQGSNQIKSKSTYDKEINPQTRQTTSVQNQRGGNNIKEPTHGHASTSSGDLTSSSDSEAQIGNNIFVEHREKFENVLEQDIIDGQRNLNGRKYSNHSSTSSHTLSSSTEEEIKRKCTNVSTLDEVVLCKLEKQSPISIESVTDHTSSDSRSNLTPENSFMLAQEDSASERKYQTLPIHRRENNSPITERSKSFNRPVEIETDYLDDRNMKGSSISVIERKYHEYTETWSSQSPIEVNRIIRQPPPKLEKMQAKKSNKSLTKQIVASLTRRPRPVPSYMSPVNAFPFVPPEEESLSNESIVNEYSADRNAEEIITRQNSLPDFINEISHKKLRKPNPVKKRSTPEIPIKVKVAPTVPDMNYGDEEVLKRSIKEDNARRPSFTSVTTDTSYLDQPILSRRPLTSKIALPDSVASYSTSLNTASSDKSCKEDSLSRRTISSTSSTSASSLESDSNYEARSGCRQSIPVSKHQIVCNQLLQGKYPITNFPLITSNNANLRKIPSSSESSEYSSTSDEESSSSNKFLETELD